MTTRRDSTLDAERSLLAALLLERAAIERARRSLDASAFSLVAHAKTYGAILALADRGEPVDSVTVANELRQRGELEAVGGPAAISRVLESAGTSANVEAYARIILGAHRDRKAGRLARDIAQRIEAGDSGEEVSTLASKLDRLCSGTADTVRVNLMSGVQPEAVQWLWPGRIPLGMVTVFDGDPGLGKSTVTLDLAARLSRGWAMPDGSTGPEASGVVILSAEDDAARVVRPRLDAAGADVERIATVQLADDEGGTRDLEICRADLAPLERGVREVGALLVVIDPLMAFLPADVNAHRDQDVRRALAALRAFAERTGVAVLVVRHLNKSTGGSPLYRGGGSIGIIGAARAGLLMAVDPDDASGEGRVLAVSKANLALRPTSLKLRLAAERGALAARVRWEGESQHTAGTLLAQPEDPEERSALDEAEARLRELLACGDVGAEEGEREARAAGISERTLRRARHRLGVESHKVGRPGERGQRWVWRLPSKAAEGRQNAADAPDVGRLRPSDDGKPLCEADDAEGGQIPEDDRHRVAAFGGLPGPVARRAGESWEPVLDGASSRAADPVTAATHQNQPEPAPELPFGDAL